MQSHNLQFDIEKNIWKEEKVESQQIFLLRIRRQQCPHKLRTEKIEMSLRFDTLNLTVIRLKGIFLYFFVVMLEWNDFAIVTNFYYVMTNMLKCCQFLHIFSHLITKSFSWQEIVTMIPSTFTCFSRPQFSTLQMTSNETENLYFFYDDKIIIKCSPRVSRWPS